MLFVHNQERRQKIDIRINIRIHPYRGVAWCGAWRSEMSRKRQPQASAGPRRAGGGGGGEPSGSTSCFSLPQRPAEPKRQRIALREWVRPPLALSGSGRADSCTSLSDSMPWWLGLFPLHLHCSVNTEVMQNTIALEPLARRVVRPLFIFHYVPPIFCSLSVLWII
jgi:hypothetical protein